MTEAMPRRSAEEGRRDWRKVEIRECGEPLVPLDTFFCDPIYFGGFHSSPYAMHELNGSLSTLFAREGVAIKLEKAQSTLPPRHRFLVWDAYRPISVQESLYKSLHQKMEGEHPDWTQDVLKEELRKYVSVPSDNANSPSTHLTGGALDLTIVEVDQDILPELEYIEEQLKDLATGRGRDSRIINRGKLLRKKSEILRGKTQLLDMGTPFDFVGIEAATDFYKFLQRDLTDREWQAALNRLELQNAIESVGGVCLDSEWWHVDFGNQFAAARQGGYATYGKAQFSSENQQLETASRDAYFTSLTTATIFSALTGGDIWHADPRLTNHPLASRM